MVARRTRPIAGRGSVLVGLTSTRTSAPQSGYLAHMTFLRRLVAIVLLVGVATWGTYYVTHRHTSLPTTTTTTTAPVAVAPLSGQSDPSGASLTRPALTVKIENTPGARPLWGVDQADVVYEEIVNGGITRLAAMFNLHLPTRVGPVRSVRPTDVGVVSPVGGIFAYSGGAPYAIRAIQKAPVTLVDETRSLRHAGMFRDHTRFAPENLYLIAPRIVAFGGAPVPPPALFTYRSPRSRITGVAARTLTVNLPSIYAPTFTWNPITKTWDRSIFGRPDITATHVRISPKNVIVMWINYAGGVGTMNSVGQLVGSGPAAVFQDGKEIPGSWSRSAINHPTVYRNAKGKVISMLPGQTWIVLPALGEKMPVAP